MKKVLTSLLVSTIVLLLLSIGMLYVSIYLFPDLSEEYFSPVFRSSGKIDWMYYVHPVVISIALQWFWKRYKIIFKGGVLLRAMEVSLVYCVVAMIPVLWLTFSAIDISVKMVLTWLLYGLIQSFAAGIVFAKMNP